MDLPLSKTLDPIDDYPLLGPELAEIDRLDLSGQHEHRRWEYAMALRALNTWNREQHPDVVPRLRILDVGGAGSPFVEALWRRGHYAEIIDPKVNVSVEQLTYAPVPVITCISTIEHVDCLKYFVEALARDVLPNGLLFLTADCWDCEGPDVAHFHWMRNRIFTVATWKKLLIEFQHLGFSLLGPADWAYHGNHVYDYSFISLALIKRLCAKKPLEDDRADCHDHRPLSDLQVPAGGSAGPRPAGSLDLPPPRRGGCTSARAAHTRSMSLLHPGPDPADDPARLVVPSVLVPIRDQ